MNESTRDSGGGRKWSKRSEIAASGSQTNQKRWIVGQVKAMRSLRGF